MGPTPWAGEGACSLLAIMLSESVRGGGEEAESKAVAHCNLSRRLEAAHWVESGEGFFSYRRISSGVARVDPGGPTWTGHSALPRRIRPASTPAFARQFQQAHAL